MSSTYNYSLENDFSASHNIKVVQFVLEIQNESAITKTLTNIGVDGDSVSFIFESSLSGPEISALDALVEAHIPQSDQYDTVALLTDERGTGEDGGTFTSGAWRVRALNTLHGSNINTWLTLSVNEFSLAQGHYFLSANARSYNVGNNQLRIYDVTNDTSLFYGENSTNNFALLKHHLTVTDEWQVFRLEHRCSITQTQNGLGVANNFGGPEIYTQIKIQQL